MIQGKPGEAEPLVREALRIDKKVFGEEHLEVAIDLNNLAWLLWEQVRPFGLARTLSEKVG